MDRLTGGLDYMFSWWIEEPTILAGSCPTESQLRELYREGFRIIVSLIDEREQPPLYNGQNLLDLGYSRYNIPISEGRFPSVGQIDQFLKIICQGSVDRKIIVHCLSGDKRTGTMAVAYWISQGRCEEDARKEVYIRRNSAIEMDGKLIPAYLLRDKGEARKYEDSGNQRDCEKMGCECQNR
jgi:atypical dual specificity phosphatase